MKIKYKIIINLVLLIPVIAFAQLHNDLVYEKALMIGKYDWNDTYLRQSSECLTNEMLADTGTYIKPGVHATALVQNSPIDPSWNYNEWFHVSATPILYGKGNEYISFYTSVMLQNAKTDYLDPRKRYLGENVSGFWIDFEVSKIQFKNKNILVKFGRDYFMPGMYFYESILFSKYQYTYDQLYVSYFNKILQVSSYYLRLNDMVWENERYLRHLNGHRVSFNLGDNGYIALNEQILYTGIQRPINPALFNPFLVYYAYQRNENIEATNSMLSLDFFYHYNKYFIHGEFILDDYMVDHERYSDLEPTKFGLNITLGVKDIIPGLHWNINHTQIANRVYSTLFPENNLERFLHENLPMGHYMGSNLFEWKSTLSYFEKKYKGELKFIYRAMGDDVVYSPYNTDHFQGHEYNDLLEPGADWDESFPYVSDGSEPSVFWGFEMNHYYQVLDYFGLNLKAAYWIEKGDLESSFNVTGGIYFNF